MLSLSSLQTRFSFENAKSAWSSREGILLQIQDEAGLVGLGEASPLPNYSRETLNDTAQRLQDAASSITTASDNLSTHTIQELSQRLALTPSARFAVESALLDLLGQQRQCSVASLLCERPGSELPINALLTLKEERETIEGAKKLAAMGYRTIKIKLRSMQSEKDFTLIEAIHQELPEIQLRLDANGSWSIEEARGWLSRYRSIAAMIEQPVAVGSLAMLERCQTPWAADESLQDPTEADEIIAKGAASALVLKPAALGGFFRCLLLAQNRKSFVTHLFDGPVAMAATCELARALPGELLDCGLDAHEGLSLLPCVEAPHRLETAKRKAPRGFGLGFSEQEREAIAAYVSRSPA